MWFLSPFLLRFLCRFLFRFMVGSVPLRVPLGQALAAYEERELPALKAEKPGLKLRQYKQMIFEQASACDLVV